MFRARDRHALERLHKPPRMIVGQTVCRIAEGMVQQRFDHRQDPVRAVLAFANRLLDPPPL
jgi:hypothetical protein